MIISAITSPRYIYFYFADGEEKPLYIGQTDNICLRFKQHKRQNKAFERTDKIYYITIPDDYTIQQCTLLEFMFIWNCDPIMNLVTASDDRCDGKARVIWDYRNFVKRGKNLLDTIKKETDGIYSVEKGKIIRYQSMISDFTEKKVKYQ